MVRINGNLIDLISIQEMFEKYCVLQFNTLEFQWFQRNPFRL